MSVDRLQRAGMLVELRQRAVEIAQAESADATRRAQESDQASQQAADLWAESTRASAGERPSSVDLAELSAWQHTLRQRADRAVVQAGVARTESERRRTALVTARSELRKIEVWRDGLAAVARASMMRSERVAADEVAARIVRRQQ